VLVAASGNSGIEEVLYPAGFYNVLAVGATDQNDNIASWSTYGNYMDLVAPGVDILTTGLSGTSYVTDSGTSFAAPHVSGVAALVWSQNPSFEQAKIYDVLRSTAVDLGTPGFDNRYGYGKVDAYAAVALGRVLSSTSGSLSGTGSSYTYSISVPALSSVRVVMTGNENSDFDLYARWNAPPTTSTYDAMEGSGASLEAVTVKGSGTLYIMVYSYSGGGRWKSWAISGNPGLTTRNWGSLSGGMDSRTYSLYGPGIGYAFCSGPDGSDFDLYLKWNSPPSTSSYDSAGLTGWPMEITGPVTNVGDMYYMIYSYSGSGDYTTEAEIY